MERRIFLGVLGATLLGLAATILLPGGRSADPSPKLPWDIRIAADDSLEVLGLRLGESSLQAARQLFEEEGKVSLFRVGDRGFAVEAFFQQVNLSGLRADIVLALEVPPETLEAFFQRGLRISKAESGASKVTLAPEDLASVAEVPIKQITYLPAAKLDRDLIALRFGEPSERVPEADSPFTHWLYPGRGLDIAFNAQGQAVMQYVPLRDFPKLVEPLRRQSTSGSSPASRANP